MTSAASPSAWRISLRQLLALFTAVILGLTALRYANKPWQAGVSFVTLAAFIGSVVLALVDRGARQAAAIGFMAGAGIYLMLVYAMRGDGSSRGNNLTVYAELDPDAGQLPTTLALRPIYGAIRTEQYSDPLGAMVQRQSPMFMPPGGGSGGYVTFAGETPNRNDFMRIGHCLWALIFGYVAAKFARWAHVRRTRVQFETATPVSRA